MITPESFVDAVKTEVCEGMAKAVLETLTKPPGRAPRKETVELSKWFITLSESDRLRVAELVRFTSISVGFSFLAVLDGVKVVEDGDSRGELELFYRNGETLTRLNDPKGEMLHDLFNAV